MRFELSVENVLAWIGRLISNSTSPSELPRGSLIVMLALGCWLAIALLVWGALTALGS